MKNLLYKILSLILIVTGGLGIVTSAFFFKYPHKDELVDSAFWTPLLLLISIIICKISYSVYKKSQILLTK